MPLGDWGVDRFNRILSDKERPSLANYSGKGWRRAYKAEVDTLPERAFVEGDGGRHLAGVQHSLVSAHLLVLTRLLKRSAQRDYEGMEPENWVERRLILTLLRMERAGVSDLAASLGNDISQVSRSLGTLQSSGLVEREGLRGVYWLTEIGQDVGQRFDRLAQRRDIALIQGFEPLQLFELAGILAALSTRAIGIHIDEAERGKGITRKSRETAAPEIYGRVVPAIFGLSNYIARGATLAIKRLTGLSQYEWRVLAFVASRPDRGFAELVERTDSDKAQLSRALNVLLRRGLMARDEAGNGSASIYALTDKGQDVHAIMRVDALRRNDLLLMDLSPSQRARLMSALEQLIFNAQEMDRHE